MFTGGNTPIPRNSIVQTTGIIHRPSPTATPGLPVVPPSPLSPPTPISPQSPKIVRPAPNARVTSGDVFSADNPEHVARVQNLYLLDQHRKRMENANYSAERMANLVTVYTL